MMPDGFGYQQRSNDRNWVFGSVAIILSAIFHVTVMYYLSDLRLSRAGGDARARIEREYGTDRIPAMRVEAVSLDAPQPPDKVPGERDAPSHGPIEVSDKVDTLSQEASPALVTPPPVPRDAISPDALVREAPKDVDPTPWMPRQEIKQIFDRRVQEELAKLPRHEIPVIERVPQALAVVPAIDLAGRQFGSEPEPPAPMRPAEVFDTKIMEGTFAVAAPENITPEQTLTRIEKTTAAATPPAVSRTGTPPPGSGPGVGAPGDPSQPPAGNAALPDSLLQTAADQPARPADAIEQAVTEANKIIEARLKGDDFQPIDDKLEAHLETYRDPQEPSKVYFKVTVQPRKDALMPVIPKDIIWVQDVSGSMTEERLLFCRRALTTALDSMNPQDRFAVIAFRDTILTAFQGWEPVSPESIKKAAGFISGMRSFGSTDIFGSLKTLMALPRDPARPMVVLFATDGKPTAGMTESSEIIGAFSRLNSGMMSIYMYGTHKDANVYLIDMLTYCNRGNAVLVKGNRWDIPTSMAEVYMGFRNPVMSDVNVIFDPSSKSEIYPRRTTNLYQNSPIEVFGLCPDSQSEIVFQMRGLAADKGYESLFRIPLAQAKPGKADLKTRWARQKMFMLASVYTRESQSKNEMLTEMRRLSQSYGIPMPYPTNVK